MNSTLWQTKKTLEPKTEKHNTKKPEQPIPSAAAGAPTIHQEPASLVDAEDPTSQQPENEKKKAPSTCNKNHKYPNRKASGKFQATVLRMVDNWIVVM